MEEKAPTVDIEQEVKQEEAAKQAAPQEADKSPAIDYERLEKIVSGRQAATEESVLKGYFKQQGMEPEEMKSAIEAYKTQKAQATPDLGAMQAQMQAAQMQADQQIQAATQRALQAEIQAKAVLMAADLGVNPKAMPFIIRAADTQEAITDSGIDEAKLRSSLEEVVEAIPALKQQTQAGGFQTIGADINGNATPTSDESALKRAFGIKN